MDEEFDDLEEFTGATPQIELTKNLKETVEKRLGPIPIKDIILGRGKQTVPIIPDALEVTFRSPLRGEFVIIRRMAQTKRDTGGTEIDNDKLASFHLSLYIERVNDMDLQPIYKDGRVDEKAIRHNARLLHELDDALLYYVALNRSWFALRVQKALEDGMLKNG